MSADVLHNFVGTEEWFQLTPEEQQASLDTEFNNTVAKDERYINATPEDQVAFRDNYNRIAENTAYNSPNRESNQIREAKQYKADRSSFVKNVTTKMYESAEGTVARAGMVDDALYADGEVDKNLPQQLEKYINLQNEKIVTTSEKRLAASFERAQKKAEGVGFWNDAAAWGQFITELPSNAKGIIDVGADSIASMATMGAGAKAGAAVAAGTTAATGGAAAPAAPFIIAAGMWGAELADAGSAKFAERVQNELQRREMAPTAKNISKILEDKDWVKQQQTDSRNYGSVLGAVDVALGGFFSKIATLPTRAARNAALRSISGVERAAIREVAASRNMSTKALMEEMTSKEARNLLQARSFSSKLKSHITSYAGEVASEPASEAAATSAAGEKNTTKNLVYETLGSIGTGPIGAAINTGAFGTKLAKDATGEVVNKIKSSTPETRAAKKEAKAAAEAAKKQADSRNDVNFNKDVKNTDAADAVVDTWADPNNEGYDPIKAMATLAKSTDVDASEKAETVYANMREEVTAISDKMAAIEQKPEAELTVADKELHQELGKELEYKIKSLGQAYTHLEGIRNKRTTESNTKDIIPVNEETATSEDVVSNITDGFGSTDHTNSLTIEQTDKLLENDNIDDKTKEVLQAGKEASRLRKLLDTAHKTIQDVSNDIYNGIRGSQFKGITGYKNAISEYLNSDNKRPDAARKQLDQLRAFRDTHQSKADEFNAALDTAIKQGLPYGKGIQVEYNGTTYEIHKGSKAFVDTVNMEAEALSKETILTEKLLEAHGISVDTNSQTQNDNNTETKSEAPAAESTIDYVQAEKLLKQHKNYLAARNKIQSDIEGRGKGYPSEQQALAIAKLNDGIKNTKKKLAELGLSNDEMRRLYKEVKAGNSIIPDTAASANTNTNTAAPTTATPNVIPQAKAHAERVARAMVGKPASERETIYNREEDKVRNKYGDDIANIFRDALDKAANKLVNSTNSTNSTKPAEPVVTQSTNEDLKPKEILTTKNEPFKRQANAETRAKKLAEQNPDKTYTVHKKAENNYVIIEETKNNPTDALNDESANDITEPQDVGDIQVEYLDEQAVKISKSFNEAMDEIDQEIVECQKILNCINS